MNDHFEAYFLKVLAFVIFTSFFLEAAEPQSSKALGRVEAIQQDATGNAGLFIGVNEFQDESLRTLNFAVNDAIAQAHLFVLELNLIPPTSATLLLSGNAGTEEAKKQLAALVQGGVRVSSAHRSLISILDTSLCGGSRPGGYGDGIHQFAWVRGERNSVCDAYRRVSWSFK